jgi:curli production assembly/transport component CsgG
MKRVLILSILVLTLSGCAISQKVGILEEKPKPMKQEMIKELDSVPPPAKGRLTVAVYNFSDKTGQRKATPGVASFSTAVTQGGDALLIRALQDVGHGTWFDVVERGNIDALTKERLIITQMRQAYEGANAQKLMPLQFAGIIIEGGIIGYDSGLESGGVGYNFLGIGPTTQYSKDVITISLRAVSVNTGKILATIAVTKTVLSTGDAIAIFKSIDPGSLSSMIKQIGAPNTGSTSAVAGIFQFESGITINEATTIALKAAVESAVVELIREGERKGIWEFKYPMPVERPWYDFGKPEVPVVAVKKETAVEVKNVDPKKTSPTATDPVIPLSTSKKEDVPADVAAKEGVVK